MTQSQFAAPLIVRDGRTTPLQRVAFGDREYNEDWLQRLLFEHPRLLPIGEIEPWFDDAMPVVRELPTRAGPLDLLYVNARGYLTLVETKLWRNPQARREVVGQVNEPVPSSSAHPPTHGRQVLPHRRGVEIMRVAVRLG